MKQVLLLLLMTVFCLSTSSTAFATASSVSVPASTVKKGIVEKFVAKIAAKAESKITKMVSYLPIKKAEDSKFIIAILLALFLGGIGIHRVYLGGKPTLILFYFLLNILFGFGAILALIDLIVMLIDGNTGKFDGKDKLFAAFG